MGTLALISLGSNLGDRKAHLDFAVAALSITSAVEVKCVSAYHQTTPVGGPDGQGLFLNAALLLETTKEPLDLLDSLNAVEHQAGRVRSQHWGERTLDLDLLLFGNQYIDTPRLQVPHPLMALRRFVLAPATEIAPNVTHALTRKTILTLLHNLDRRPSYLAMFPLGREENLTFQKIVAGLKNVGLSRGSEFASCTPPSIEAYLRVLDQTAQLLQVDRYLNRFYQNHWVVTEFMVDHIVNLAQCNLSPEKYKPIRDRFLELRETIIAPTFLVMDRRMTVTMIQDWVRSRPPGIDFALDLPIFRPQSDNNDEIASEVVAACKATREG